MSFLKKLFGGGGAARGVKAEPVEHDGYTITATPQSEGGQFRICGVISREIDGEVREHQLIRADLFPVREECVDATLRKAKQVIHEQGDRLFD